MIRIRYFFTHLLWLCMCSLQWLKFHYKIKRSKRTQIRYLQQIIKLNQHTTFGKDHRFNQIKNVQDFKQNIPIRTYEDFEPYITKVTSGDDLDALTSDVIKLFEPTSGSSSSSKLIPYTKTLSNEFQNGIGPWLFDLYRHKKMSLTGTSYWSITPLTEGKSFTATGIPIGFEEDSQYFGKIGKALIDQIMCVPKEVKNIQSVSTFKYVTLLFLLRDEHLNLISVWNPTFLVLLLEHMNHHWHDLLNDIERGTITITDDTPNQVLQVLNKKNKPNKRRTQYLKKLNPNAISQIWPKLKLVSCWTEANAEPYYQELKLLLGDIEIQGKGLLATECFISFPLIKQPYSILSLNSHFFEFLPLHNQQDTKLLDELEIGKQYVIIVTTGGGLYRYNLSDIVEVMGYKKGVPLLKFIGRQNQILDHFGEKLNESHVSQVLTTLFKEMKLSPSFYMVAFDTSHDIPHYTLYIESNQISSTMLKLIDHQLDENFHYHYCKKIGQLGNLRLFQIHSDGKVSYQKRLQENGMKLGNIKPSVLSKLSNWNDYFNGKMIE